MNRDPVQIRVGENGDECIDDRGDDIESLGLFRLVLTMELLKFLPELRIEDQVTVGFLPGYLLLSFEPIIAKGGIARVA